MSRRHACSHRTVAAPVCSRALRALAGAAAASAFELPDGTRPPFGPPDAEPRRRASGCSRTRPSSAASCSAGDIGVGESYMAGEWEADDLADAADARRRERGALAVASPLTRPATSATTCCTACAATPAAAAAATSASTTTCQRLLPPLPRRGDDDLLERRLRDAADQPLADAQRNKCAPSPRRRSSGRATTCSRSAAAGAASPCSRRASTAAASPASPSRERQYEAGPRAGRRGRPVRPRRDPPAGLPRRHGHLRQGGLDRDVRGPRPRALAGRSSGSSSRCSRRTGSWPADDLDPRPPLRGLRAPLRLDPEARLPGRPARLAAPRHRRDDAQRPARRPPRSRTSARTTR